MPILYTNPHQPGCPWHSFTELVGAPNLKWCEETICSIISEPSNTWSNLAYLFLAVIMMIQSKNHDSKDLKKFGPFIFLLGLASFFYHASNHYFSQFVDFLGMYLFVYWCVMTNCRRSELISKSNRWKLFWGLFILSSIAVQVMYDLNLKFQLIILAAAIGIVATETICMKRGKSAPHYRYFGFSLFFLVIAEIFSILDMSRIYCDPTNHFIQPHALWHLLSATGIYFAYRHYYEMKDLD